MDNMTPIVAAAALAAAFVLILKRPRGWTAPIAGLLLAAVFLLTTFTSQHATIANYTAAFGPALTVLSTLVMSAVLESLGIFRYAAVNMIEFSKGSGLRLYWVTALFCFLMTMFFSTYVSIMVATPIIVRIAGQLGMSDKQRMPYLVSGVLIGSAASAPIGAANVTNLAAFELLPGHNLNRFAEQMFVPSLIAVAVIAGLLFLLFRGRMPKRLAEPAKTAADVQEEGPPVEWRLFRIAILVVVTVRAGFFIGSGFEVPIWCFAFTGALLLIVLGMLGTGRGLRDIAAKTPWYIPLFALSASTIADGLQQTGIPRFIAFAVSRAADFGDLPALLTAGGLLAVMSGIAGQLPSLLLGTLSLTDMSAGSGLLQLIFSAHIMGANIGGLITPVGAFAPIMWMLLLRRHQVKLSWTAYMKAAAVTIPAGLVTGLISLYAWTQIIG